MHYAVGDQPVGMVFPVPEEFDDIDVTTATVLLDGAVLTAQTYDDDDEREVTAAANTPFALPGLVEVILVVLAGTGSVKRELEPIVVEPTPADGWHTLTSARRGWPDAPHEDEELYLLLLSARRACVSFLGGRALSTVGGVEVPVIPSADWRRAQILQARAIWQAGRVNRGDDGQFGGDGSTVSLFPLNRDIRHLLIPKTRIPRFL